MDTAKTKSIETCSRFLDFTKCFGSQKKALTKRVKMEITSLDYYARIINLLSYSSWNKDVSSGFLMKIHNCITDLTDKYGYPT